MTTFDRLEWHLGAALDRGRPPEHAFTHIALYLAWLIRHDLLAAGAIPATLETVVASGGVGGSAVRDALGDDLVSDVMTAQGAAFTEWYYPQYLDDYAAAFADRPDYAVADDAAAEARIAPTIDRQFAEWLAAEGGEPPAILTIGADELATMSEAELDAAAGELADAITGTDAGWGDRRGDAGDADDADGGAWSAAESPDADVPHAAPDLEALLPAQVGAVRLERSSARVSDWPSSLLRQAIENVGADPAEAFVAIGLGGTDDDALAVTLYAIPGVAQDRLEAEFSRDAYLPAGQSWQRREVDGTSVWWASAEAFDTAFYALGGLVFTVGGSPAQVRAVLELLP